MSTRTLPRVYLSTTVLFLCVIPVIYAWWDEKCAEDGQCSTMFKNYESLIKGEGCRSFYYTGKCSRICTYSLKSLINRHTWAKCAERCEWSKAITDGIASWLDMCLANPAPDLFQPDDNDPSSNTSTGNNIQPNEGKYSSFESRSSRRWLNSATATRKVVFVLVIALVCVVAIFVTSKNKSASYNRTLNAFHRIWRQLSTRNRRKGGSRRGPLDIGPDREELKNLQRGARRHLKAMRATLD